MCDADRNKYEIFKDIINHRKNAQSISIYYGYDICPNGQEKTNKTTLGWNICVEFIDISTECIPLQDVKKATLYNYPNMMSQIILTKSLTSIGGMDLC